MADPHGWHLFDVDRGYEVRQTTPDGEDDRYEVRDRAGHIVILDAKEFEDLRTAGPSPKGLD
ncbi:hypothetical protein [Glycomyces sp. NPDC021274]|uniref:hypothetical protein n=1 Tax=Glycomyces sp. NPDC021274 TaxID=3155120 RepID=UPI0033CA17AC